LEADGAQIVKWWIDGSFAVHEDMKGHTGATMSMGAAPLNRSLRKSGIETELVGVDNVMPQVLRTRHLILIVGSSDGRLGITLYPWRISYKYLIDRRLGTKTTNRRPVFM
jgi:hypothetical protein